MELISFPVVLAAVTRSAQVPFSSWLLAAIAAPTPLSASALVHSSTLVTAGVYLLVRFSPSFGYWLNVFLLLILGLTICSNNNFISTWPHFVFAILYIIILILLLTCSHYLSIWQEFKYLVTVVAKIMTITRKWRIL
jgi:NADH:ubiquinone oxidoreductase subunit 5 (subunit L)/multisubunit Na+/H+ antiporter MnhA subunit